MNKKRREHNTKRVGQAFRGNKWDLNKESVHVIPRTADKVEPKKPNPDQFSKGDWHRPNPDEGKPKGGYGGSPVTPKPKPKSPAGGQTMEEPKTKAKGPHDYNSPYGADAYTKKVKK